MLNTFVGNQVDYSCISLVTPPVTTVTVDHPSCEMPTADSSQDNSTEWITPVAAAAGAAAFVVAFVLLLVYILRVILGKPGGGNPGKIPF